MTPDRFRSLSLAWTPATLTVLALALPLPLTVWAWPSVGWGVLVGHGLCSLWLMWLGFTAFGPAWRTPERPVVTEEVHALLAGTPLAFDEQTGSLVGLAPAIPVSRAHGRYGVGRYDLTRPHDRDRLAELIETSQLQVP